MKRRGERKRRMLAEWQSRAKGDVKGDGAAGAAAGAGAATLAHEGTASSASCSRCSSRRALCALPSRTIERCSSASLMSPPEAGTSGGSTGLSLAAAAARAIAASRPCFILCDASKQKI